MSSVPGFIPPVQERSERTLQRMVAAAREALGEKSFDDLSLQELTENAGVTVGAFYQRFPSKAAFLEYLEGEAVQDIRERSAELFQAPTAAGARSVGEYLRAFVSGMAAIYLEHGPMLRELLQRSRSSEPRQQRRIAMTGAVVAQAVDWILAQGGEDVTHSDPRKALSVALLFTSSALRDVILFGETWAGGGDPANVDELVDELVRAAEAYLGLSSD